ncbi:MAG: AraC family transcriptional regulator, partial [Pseudomonadota bacterium]
MKPPAHLLVPFREVRHDLPDDCIHYESVAVRGAEMDWTIPAHRHEGLHQFQLLAAGAVEGTIDALPFQAAAPAMLMLAPGSVHAFRYARESVGHQLTLPTGTLEQLLAGSALAASQLGSSYAIGGESVAACAAECVWLFESLAREFASSDAGRAHALLAHATLIAVRFLRCRGESESGTLRQGLRDTLVQRFKALVERHYREHRPLAFYAQALGVTPDHLSRACLQVTGEPALDVLHERLMLEARRLLAYSS